MYSLYYCNHVQENSAISPFSRLVHNRHYGVCHLCALCALYSWCDMIHVSVCWKCCHYVSYCCQYMHVHVCVLVTEDWDFGVREGEW